jgi:general secretion pathway protein A
MYHSFFHLSRNPFDLTPDPRCFVSTKRHDEALSVLYYGIRQHKGFVVVTGEVGTGKTLLLRCLLGLFKESKDIVFAYLFNARLTSTEFLQYILADFGLPISGKGKAELLFDLAQFVIERGSKNQTTVLIVDEAHHLSEDILEEVRLLANLETTDNKLLQIVLVGQPELDAKLDNVCLRQLKQRIAVRTKLGPLDAEETQRYIERRLVIAGADKNACSLITEEAVLRVYRHSRGLPRLINTLCENGLITAYARHLSVVTPNVIDDVAAEFRLGIIEQAEADSADSSKEEIQRAIKLLLDLYPKRQTVIAGDSALDKPGRGSEQA